MRFWQFQSDARLQTVRLLLWFALMVTVLVVSVNAALALCWKVLAPFSSGWPALFFETNTAVVLLFVLGGCWLESQRLREGGGVRVARWMGGREVHDDGDALTRRLVNVVDEMALASGQPVPRLFVLPRETAINAFAAGWSPEDAALCVTAGALERLNRAELQALVAHEFGHIAEGDGRLSMRLLALVWGLSLLHGWGRWWMRGDDEGRVNPVLWLFGGAMALTGWLGWGCGQLLQAAVFRQREFLADARAIQFTRARDGLGQVLRKVLHDQTTHTERLRHPQADMLAFLWLHAPGWLPSLATHPPLIERIQRVYGAPRYPLPSSPTEGLNARLEPRTAPRGAQEPPPAAGAGASFASGAARAAAPGMATASSLAGAPGAGFSVQSAQGAGGGSPTRGTVVSLSAMPRLIPDDDTQQALGRLRRLSGPMQRRHAILALMMTPENEAERHFWEQSTRNLHDAARILQDVQGLPEHWRLPEFERLLAEMAYEPLEQRRALVMATRELLRADGKVSARDRLWWLALRHRMGEVTGGRQMIRPMGGQGPDLTELSGEERAHIARFSAYLARLLPAAAEPTALPATEGLSWYRSVMRRCLGPGQECPACAPPDADGLMHALAGTQELSWVIRPQLVRAWVEEALNHSPAGLMSGATADALRLAAGLLDTPMPPALAAHYPRG